MRTAPSLTRQVCISMLVLFVVYLASPNRLDAGGDSFLLPATAYSIVHEQNLDLSEFSTSRWQRTHYAPTAINGRVVNYFPWLTAVFMIPAVVLQDVAGVISDVPSSKEAAASGATTGMQALSAGMISAIAAGLLALVTRRLFELADLPLPRFGVMVWTLVIGLGTGLWSTASRAMWQHGPSIAVGAAAMLVLLHLLGRDPDRQHGWLAAGCGALLAAAYWIRPVNAALWVVAFLTLWMLDRRSILRVGAGMLGAHGAVIILNQLWLGTPWPPYFSASRATLHSELPQAVTANLLSPARGLIVFSPFLLGALLLLARSRRSLLSREIKVFGTASGIGAVLGLLTVSAYAEKWWAGHSFGPRFMSETLILLAPLGLLGLFMIPANRTTLSRVQQLVIGTLIALSVLANVGGAVIPASECWNSKPPDVDRAPSRIWDWREGQLLAGPASLANDGLSALSPRVCPT